MKFSFLLVLVLWTAPFSLSVCAQPPAEKEAARRYQSVFAQMVKDCATTEQDELMRMIRILDAVIKPQAPSNKPYVGTFADPLAEAKRLLAKAAGPFPRLKVSWKNGEIQLLGDVKPVDLAQGVARSVLVEIVNEDPKPQKLTVREGLDKPQFNKIPPIPPGKTGLCLASLCADETKATTVEFAVAAPDGETAVTLPVKVVKAATVKGVIRDSDLDKPFPGRVWVLCSDGMYRHGKAFADNQTVSEKTFIVPNGFEYMLPFFYSDGEFEIQVPPGKTTISLERGFEHPIVSKTLNLKAGETVETVLESGRMVDMKQLGWISGDTHVHWAKNWWDENESLNLLEIVQRAEDVQVVNNLTLRGDKPGKGDHITPNQFPMGPVPQHSDETYLVQMGEEYRNAPFYGHYNYLNIKRIIMPISTGDPMNKEALDYPINYTKHLEARAQGGIVIPAHGFRPAGAANMALGVIDSLDQFRQEDYYNVLDAGFRLPLTNGSDHPARLVGCVRAYVKIDGPLTYARWIEGIRNKRTFSTSGPLLFLDVNGGDIGDEICLKKGDTLTVKARAVSRQPVGRLQIVSNSEVLAETVVEGNEGQVEFEMKADESRWVVARCTRDGNWAMFDNTIVQPGIAHTSAVYVLVDGKPIFRKETVEAFAKKVRAHGTHIEKNAKFANDSQRREAVEVMVKAAEIYDERLAEFERKSAE